MKNRLLWTLPVIFLAACAPKAPDVPPPPQVRSVIVQVVQPQPLSVKIKLPVLIRPREELELRAAAPGRIVSLPFKEGDIVPADKLPEPKWLEVDEFTTANPQATQDEIEFRNARHLVGFNSFARTDSTALRQSFREMQVNYDQAVRDLKRVEDYPQSTGAQLDAARTRRSMARAGVDRTLAMLEDTYIRNPIQGVLTERMHQQGEYVNGGELVGKVAVMDSLKVEMEVPEAHRQAVIVGGDIEVTIGSLKDDHGAALKRSAKVVRIDAVAHPVTHTFTVELNIPNADLALPAGLFGTVYLTIYQSPNALVVPLAAVKLNGSKKSLLIVSPEDNTTVIELDKVEPGHFTAEWVEVLGAGLKPGMRVITFGAQSIGPGDHVSFSEEPAYKVRDAAESAR